MAPRIVTSPTRWAKWGWIVESVAARHGVSVEHLLGRQLSGKKTCARQDLYGSLYGSGLSCSAIARLLGRDHTTVLEGLHRDLPLRGGLR